MPEAELAQPFEAAGFAKVQVQQQHRLLAVPGGVAKGALNLPIPLPLGQNFVR